MLSHHLLRWSEHDGLVRAQFMPVSCQLMSFLMPDSNVSRLIVIASIPSRSLRPMPPADSSSSLDIFSALVPVNVKLKKASMPQNKGRCFTRRYINYLNDVTTAD